MMMMNTLANALICLSNDFMRVSSFLIRSIAELSPDAVKALEDKRNALQVTRDEHFSILLLMTKFVFWGVILEGPELIYEIAQGIRRWRRLKTREHAPGWITVIGLVGWMLVSVGLVGEFAWERKVNTDDNGIQSANIDLLRDAGTSASIAKQSSSDAAVAAGKAQGSADKADAAAKGAKGKADAAGIAAGNAQHQADAATATAKHLGIVASERELQLVADAIKLPFKVEVFKQLEQEPRPTQVQISCIDDERTALFARALNDVLGSSGFGWKTLYIDWAPFPEEFPRGITIVNEWASWPTPLVGQWPGDRFPGARELGSTIREVMGKNPGLTQQQAVLLVTLGVALNARLKKGSSLQIWIGLPESTTDKTNTR